MINLAVDHQDYDRAIGDEKLKILVDWAEKAASLLFEKTGHSSAPVKRAAMRLRTLGVTPTFILGPLRTSPNRKLKGTIEVEMKPDQFSYNYLFFDRKGILQKRVACKTIEREYSQWEFLRTTGVWDWLSDDQFVFTSWGGSPCWTLSLSTGEIIKTYLVSKRLGPSIGRQSFPKVVLWEKMWEYMGIE